MKIYNETGKEIKRLATIMVYVGSVLCSLIALVPLFIVASVNQSRYDPAPDWFVFVVIGGIVLGIVGAFLCWLQHLLLAGFGELIEENAKSAAELKEIKELLREMKDK